MSLLIKAKDGHKFYNYEEGCYDYSIGVHVPVVLNASEIGWETIYAPTSLSNENERIIQRVLWNSRNIRSTTRCQVFDAIHEKYNETYEFVSDEYNPRDDKYYGAWVSIVDPNEIINVTIQPVRNGLSPINICVSRIEEKENFKINILGY
jgi:hypothetical protein